MEPLISIVVPCFNVSGTVSNSLGTIQDQSYERIEVLIIDDGSIDDTKDKIQPFLVDDRFRYLYQENKGLGSARNAGIKAAKGKYITFVDSDDWITPDFVRDLVFTAESSKSDIVRASHVVLGVTGDTKKSSFSSKDPVTDHLQMVLSGKLPNMACGKLYSLDLLRNNNLFFADRKIFHEDFCFTFKCYLHGQKFTPCNDARYIWNETAGSLSRSFSRRHAEDLVWILHENLGYLKALDLNQEVILRKLFFWKFIFWKKSEYGADSEVFPVLEQAIIDNEEFRISEADVIALKRSGFENDLFSLSKTGAEPENQKLFSLLFDSRQPSAVSSQHGPMPPPSDPVTGILMGYFAVKIINILFRRNIKVPYKTTIWFVLFMVAKKLKHIRKRPTT